MERLAANSGIIKPASITPANSNENLLEEHLRLVFDSVAKEMADEQIVTLQDVITPKRPCCMNNF